MTVSPRRLKSLVIAAVLATGLTAGAAAAQTYPERKADAVKEARVDKTPIGDLLADPRYRAILDKRAPAIDAYKDLGMVKAMTLKAIAEFPQAGLDQKQLAAIQSEFDKVR